MRKFEFESNGSKWMLVDAQGEDVGISRVGINIGKCFYSIKEVVILKNITEEQASEVVSKVTFRIGEDVDVYYKDYMKYSSGTTYIAIESLHSLLKSKGIHLYKNPYRDDWEELCTWGHGCFAKYGKSSFELFTEAEEKTFYNPVLFKIICN